jgi:GMP synthase (glutamine-hydrolysing)
MTLKPLLILQTGSASPSVSRQYGDYDRMFIRACGLEEAEAQGRLRCVHVERGERPEPPGAWAGVLVTGSDAMVSDRLPWSEAAAGWLRDALDADLPVFGVCYGHQLLAHALGGEVADHPAGQELGTHEIALSPSAGQEPLLEGIPPCFAANLFHLQTVTVLPKGATVLAASAHDPHQILRYAPMVWSTQFHPEFDGKIMSAILKREKSRNNPAAIQAVTEDCLCANAILRRFVARIPGLSGGGAE